MQSNWLVAVTVQGFSNHPYNIGGIWKRFHSEMFSVHTTPVEFRNAAITSHFGFMFEQNHMIIVIVNYFLTIPVSQSRRSFGLKLSRRNKAASSNFSAVVWTGTKRYKNLSQLERAAKITIDQLVFLSRLHWKRSNWCLF